jgi:phage terminase small subunit
MSENYSTPENPKSLYDFELTPFQADFVAAYINSKNPTEAVRKIGSKSKRPEAVASNMMKMPNVQAAINWALKCRVEAAGVNDREVITMIRRVYEEAMAAGKYNDANKAAQMLGDHLGMFRTAQIEETKIKSDAHSSGSEDVKDLRKDIKRLVESLGPNFGK